MTDTTPGPDPEKPAGEDADTRAFDDVSAAPVEEPEAEAVTADSSELDAAVERAAAVGEPDEEPEPVVVEAEVPDPVAAEAVRRETFVPATAPETPPATPVVNDPFAGAEAPVAGAAAVTAVQPRAIYVQAPEAPKNKGNRAFGILVGLLATVVFAALYAGAGYLLFLGSAGEQAGELTVQFVSRAVFWVPVAVFFLAFALLVAIVNRGAWWCYAVFGLLVGVVVYLSYVGGALLTVQAWTLTVEEASAFVSARWLDPFAILAGVFARELPIWFGGWIAARGRQVTARNRDAYEAYERELAAGPQLSR